MILNGINFPNELLEAIQNKTLVVFAGAGASVGAPTSLPNFVDLAKKIAEGTGKIINENESCEVFLGHLKSLDIDVNQQAAEILSNRCLCHNDMHDVIVDLFSDPADIKIVTTNYDQMFEQVIEEKNVSVPVFDAPALPLGEDVSGIIHVHGNVDNPKYMVVTDEDFGKAYLTDGYAARFLIKLFQSYTTLFIGYSYKDTIMRYLTRAMARNIGPHKFIMTDDNDSDWNALGITPIYFEKSDYVAEKDGLRKLGQRAKRGLLDWKNQFEEFLNYPPKDLSLETEIDYILTDFEKARILADCVCGAEWVEVLDKKGIFNTLFSPKGQISEFDQIWMNWITNKIIGKDDVAFEKLLLSKHNQIHPELAANVLRRIQISDSDISDAYLCKYIILLDAYISLSWDIFRLIEVCAERELFLPCQHLFTKFFEVSFVLEKQYWPGSESCTYKHRLNGERYQIHRAWELCKEYFLAECPERLLNLTKDVICELHNRYLVLGLDVKGNDPWQMAMLVIENRDDYLREDPLRMLCDIFFESCLACEMKKTIYVKEFLVSCLNSPSVLLKKLTLKTLRELKILSPNEKFDVFIENENISFWGGKEQIFLLIKAIFNDISEERKHHLIDLIVAQNEFEDARHNDYAKYNWCVWIKRFCQDNDRVNELEKSILSQNEFSPREHPELDIESSSAVWVQDKSPIELTEMVSLPKDELLDYLVNYNEDPFAGPSRSGLLKTFEECCRSNYCWAFDVAKFLIERHIQKEDVWNHLIQGVQDSEAKIREHISLLNLLTENVLVVGNVLALARFLWKILEQDGIKAEFHEYEDCLFKTAKVLWENRGSCDEKMERLVDASLNTILGNILISYIYMLSYSDNNGIPDKYKQFFELNLHMEGYEKRLALCVLAGYFNFFCLRDHDWCTEYLQPILESEDKEDFSAAWEGVVFFSRHLNKDVADVVAPIYLKAVTHIDWLSGEARNSFIDLYLVLMIYVIENPCQKYIPEFYKYASDADRKEFVHLIEHRLRNAEKDFRISWWNSWLKQYLENRLQNKPVPFKDAEYQIIVNWLPEVPEFFDELVNIVCNHDVPSDVDNMFLYRMNENKLVESYPHEVIKLLTVMLDGGTVFQYYTDDLAEIYKSADGLSEQEKRDFQEACLKRNIKIYS